MSRKLRALKELTTPGFGKAGSGQSGRRTLRVTDQASSQYQDMQRASPQYQDMQRVRNDTTARTLGYDPENQRKVSAMKRMDERPFPAGSSNSKKITKGDRKLTIAVNPLSSTLGSEGAAMGKQIGSGFVPAANQNISRFGMPKAASEITMPSSTSSPRSRLSKGYSYDTSEATRGWHSKLESNQAPVPVSSTLGTGRYSEYPAGKHTRLTSLNKAKGITSDYAQKGMDYLKGTGAYKATANHLERNKGKYYTAGAAATVGLGAYGYNEMTKFSKPMGETSLQDRLNYYKQMRQR